MVGLKVDGKRQGMRGLGFILALAILLVCIVPPVAADEYPGQVSGPFWVGTRWLNGTAVPSSGEGLNGDFYVQWTGDPETNGDTYQKINGTWVLVGSTVGPAGPSGPSSIGNFTTTNLTGVLIGNGTGVTIASHLLDIEYDPIGAPGLDGWVMYNEGGIEGANISFTFDNETGTLYATYFSGDGSQLTNVVAQIPAREGGQNLFFSNATATSPTNYKRLVTIPLGGPEVDTAITIKQSDGQVAANSYVTDIGFPEMVEYPAGLWEFIQYAYVSNTQQSTTITYKVYNRTSDGTETYLFEVTSDDINLLSVGDVNTYVTQANPYPVQLNDRIVIKSFVQTTSTNDVIIHLIREGTSHTSHVVTPLSTAAGSTLTLNVIAGEALYKGQAVYISGATTGIPVVSKADNTNGSKSRVLGLVVADIASGARGQVRRAGALTYVDTRATNSNLNPNGETWTAGQLLFATTGGGLTNVRPTSGRSVKAAYTALGSDVSDTLIAYPMENPVWVTAASGEDVVLRLGDDSGVNKVSIRNYSNFEVAFFNSWGIGSIITGLTGDSITNKTYVDAVNASMKAYVDSITGGSIDTTVFMFTNGTRPMTGSLDAGGFNISNVSEPVADTDAATKGYVDSLPSVSLPTDLVRNPESSTDQNIVVFNGTDGKYVNDSGHSLSEYATAASVQANRTKDQALRANLSIGAQSILCEKTNGCRETKPNDTFSNGVNLVSLDYINTGFPNGTISYTMPNDWDGGDVSVRFTWTDLYGGGGGTVVWTMTGYCQGDNGNINTAWPAVVSVTDTVQTVGAIHITDYTSPLTMGGTRAGGNTCFFRFGRDGGTMAHYASLIAAQVAYGVVS